MLYDSSEDEDEIKKECIERAYDLLEIDKALCDPTGQFYGQAVAELQAIVKTVYPLPSFPKGIKQKVERDVLDAVKKNKWGTRQADEEKLSQLMGIVNQVLPKAKKGIILREYRQLSILAARRSGKSKNIASVDFSSLPEDIWLKIFANLDPISLIHASRACKSLFSLGEQESLWNIMLRNTFGNGAVSSCCEQGQSKCAFNRLAIDFPEMLTPYKTRRFALHGFVRLMKDATWKRQMANPGEYGIACKAALYPNKVMFLSADEVALWLCQPAEETLQKLVTRIWKPLKEKRKRLRALEK
eukprot:jgi/Picsp_1/3714/NSC_06550-R1_f-box protein